MKLNVYDEENDANCNYVFNFLLASFNLNHAECILITNFSSSFP